jgi:hypothetical protein
MAFDFLGTPLLVLAMMPLRVASWVALLAALAPSVMWRLQEGGTGALPADLMSSTMAGLTFWAGSVFLAECVMWGSALGAVNREVMAHVRRRNRLVWMVSKGAYSLRMLLLAWSWALWTGLMLGGLDAVTGRNGHRRR